MIDSGNRLLAVGEFLFENGRRVARRLPAYIVERGGACPGTPQCAPTVASGATAGRVSPCRAFRLILT